MRKGSILYVDDESDVLQTEAETLKRLGYEVITSSTSTEALEIFKQQHDTIILVISDIVLPVLTGNELAKEIHAISPRIPIILLTSNTQLITTELTQQAMAIGVTCILEKPFSRADLSEAITEALQK
jgi:CheY-like chemotaxis protein